jgi:hypothetical protein
MGHISFLQGLSGRAFERAKEVDEKCRNENQVERGEQREDKVKINKKIINLSP